MLAQRCALDQHRLIIPVSVTKPQLQSGDFLSSFSHCQYRALIDTGAQRTVVSRSVIADQALMRTGHMEFAGIHGPQTHSRYLAGIAIWAKRVQTNEESLRFDGAELSLFTIPSPFEVVDMADNANFDLILGFDVLKEFSFRFDASNQMFEIIVKN
jgi:predicted aspartyl protease